MTQSDLKRSAYLPFGALAPLAEAVGMGLIVAALAVLTARGLRISRQTQLPEPTA